MLPAKKKRGNIVANIVEHRKCSCTKHLNYRMDLKKVVILYHIFMMKCVCVCVSQRAVKADVEVRCGVITVVTVHIFQCFVPPSTPAKLCTLNGWPSKGEKCSINGCLHLSSNSSSCLFLLSRKFPASEKCIQFTWKCYMIVHIIIHSSSYLSEKEKETTQKRAKD